MQETQESGVGSLGGEDPLEEGVATHPSVLARKILWTQEPGRVWSVGSQKVRHNWSNSAHTEHCSFSLVGGSVNMNPIIIYIPSNNSKCEVNYYWVNAIGLVGSVFRNYFMEGEINKRCPFKWKVWEPHTWQLSNISLSYLTLQVCELFLPLFL